MRLRLFRRLFVPVAGVLVLGAGCAGPEAEPSDGDVVPVLQQLKARGAVRLVVALEVPVAEDPQGPDLSGLQRRIAEAQDEVLEALDPASYRNLNRLQSVPSMTLTILTEAAYRTLEAHPRVRKIGLDAGGTGTSPY